ncbi:hypothetical protein HGB48_19220 [Actinomadura latina]|uniref:Uncharacterized protein n=3 Tax=Actinomadura latina TaxID=163603 RepID=A0A846Z0N9_9ACTN|nr:hypothetical protein [Actinomadura latina]
MPGRNGEPAAADVDAATHERPRPPARPVPGTASQPRRDLERADIERLKRRLEQLFPPRHEHGRPDLPAAITRSAPSGRPDAGPPDDDLGRRLDDLRREAEEQANNYKTPRWDG